MTRELETICNDLDEFLLNTLAQWRDDLESPEEATDPQSLYCLYPKLASQVSWARGTLAQVEGTMQALRQREDMEPHPAVAMTAAGGCCCPCCGGAGGQQLVAAHHHQAGGCGCRQDPGRSAARERFPETEEIDVEVEARATRENGEVTETRIYEETIVEETGNGRSKQNRRTGRNR